MQINSGRETGRSQSFWSLADFDEVPFEKRD
jgi:hypothetical protein